METQAARRHVAVEGRESTHRPVIYVWREDGRITAICSSHVDDLKLAGEPALIQHILSVLTTLFGKLKVVHKSFEHCGIWHEYQESDGSYHLHQNHFVE